MQSQYTIIIKGHPVAFLPFIHHALLTFQPDVAEWIREQGYDLYAKNDYRFEEQGGLNERKDDSVF